MSLLLASRFMLTFTFIFICWKTPLCFFPPRQTIPIFLDILDSFTDHARGPANGFSRFFCVLSSCWHCLQIKLWRLLNIENALWTSRRAQMKFISIKPVWILSIEPNQWILDLTSLSYRDLSIVRVRLSLSTLGKFFVVKISSQIFISYSSIRLACFVSQWSLY